MIHTAFRTLSILLAAAWLAAAPAPQDKVGKPSQNPEIKKVIDSLRSREKALKAVTLEMSTTGSYPSGLTFRTDGKLRVLAATHFQIEVKSQFGSEGLRTDLRKVITPKGVWTHQDGPMDDVFTFMDPALMARLKEAERALAADKETAMRNPGPMAGKGDAPLGSAMLAALDLQFELAAEKDNQKVDGVDCRVISGRWRGFKGLAPDQIPDAKDFPRAVQRVQVFLRASDGIPIRMVQYNRGKVVRVKDDRGVEVEKREEDIAFELNIRNLVLDPKLEPASFKLDVPKGTEFTPVMDHRPSRAQINRIFEEYEDLSESKKGKKGK